MYRRARIVLSVLTVIAGGAFGAPSALAAPFQRGDVFIVAGDGVREYSPSGALRTTLQGTVGAGALCFDPDGQHLILPGVGLFDSSGSPLPSSWASVTTGRRCVADGFGHVYVSSLADGYAITKYELDGTLLQRFDVTEAEAHTLAIDLAADECTIYYGSWGVPFAVISRLNGCTGVKQSPYMNNGFVDDLRVLDDSRVLALDDTRANLFDASGQPVRGYDPPGTNGDSLRTLSLDPDGTSLWACCTWTSPNTVERVFRFDIDSGALLSDWAPSNPAPFGAMTVFGPPLVGDADVAATVTALPTGTATAYSTTARSAGDVGRLHVYVDASSTATNAVVGIYSDRAGHPRTLIAKTTISDLKSGSWNVADVPATDVKAGEKYWLAVLGPRGGGTLGVRTTLGSGRAETSARDDLATLPKKWKAAKGATNASLSAYGG